MPPTGGFRLDEEEGARERARPDHRPHGACRPAPLSAKRRRVRVLLGVGGVAAALAAGFLLPYPRERASAGAAEAREPVRRVNVRGVTDSEIVFGMASPFTGANRELGRAMKTGIDTAFAEVNAAGGVHGRKLRLIALDDGYEPSRTGPVMRQLLEVEKVFAVVGNVGTPTAAVSIPYCSEHKTLFFGAFSGGDLLRKAPPERYVFNFRPSYAEETSAAVRYLVEVRRIPASRIGFFGQEDEFGESGWRGVKAQLVGYGFDPSHLVRAGYRRNSSDVGDAVEAFRSRAGMLDAVVMVSTYRAAATFIRKSRDAGLRLVFTNVSAVDANSLSEELVSSGGRYAENVIVTQIVPLPTSRAPAVARFREALRRHAPHEEPGFVSLEGWIVGNLLVEGLRRAGPAVDTERLVAALEGIRDFDMGLGATISFGREEHQGSHKVWGTEIEGSGTFRPIELQ